MLLNGMALKTLLNTSKGFNTMALGAKIRTIAKGTPIIDRAASQHTRMPYTAQVLLLAQRHNLWLFVLDGREYLIHNDNL